MKHSWKDVWTHILHHLPLSHPLWLTHFPAQHGNRAGLWHCNNFFPPPSSLSFAFLRPSCNRHNDSSSLFSFSSFFPRGGGLPACWTLSATVRRPMEVAQWRTEWQHQPWHFFSFSSSFSPTPVILVWQAVFSLIFLCFMANIRFCPSLSVLFRPALLVSYFLGYMVFLFVCWFCDKRGGTSIGRASPFVDEIYLKLPVEDLGPFTLLNQPCPFPSFSRSRKQSYLIMLSSSDLSAFQEFSDGHSWESQWKARWSETPQHYPSIYSFLSVWASSPCFSSCASCVSLTVLILFLLRCSQLSPYPSIRKLEKGADITEFYVTELSDVTLQLQTYITTSKREKRKPKKNKKNKSERQERTKKIKERKKREKKGSLMKLLKKMKRRRRWRRRQENKWEQGWSKRGTKTRERRVQAKKMKEKAENKAEGEIGHIFPLSSHDSSFPFFLSLSLPVSLVADRWRLMPFSKIWCDPCRS